MHGDNSFLYEITFKNISVLLLNTLALHRYSVSKTLMKKLGFSSILLNAVPQGENNVTELKRFTLWGALFKNETWLLQGSFVYLQQVDRGDLAGGSVSCSIVWYTKRFQV